MGTNKYWSDQPDMVLQYTQVLHVFTGGRIVELYRSTLPQDNAILVSAGNLFGSQSMLCVDIWTALRLFQMIASLKDGQTLNISDLPKGVTILGNSR